MVYKTYKNNFKPISLKEKGISKWPEFLSKISKDACQVVFRLFVAFVVASQ